ncbi:N-formylglutamate amidohydrolase [Cytobacillus depressus]|uniref:N-formylglutamate amidohydrolase n=1 Tax=Cytobacillus depressus TaxID=1602942 RepID=A0A6L3VAE7_9BACI|nr:hypothetical protein [Cytobacillus depressus]KAB2338651.1 N-formylglutamate amidohydrolase [Cytobacillus depressus]
MTVPYIQLKYIKYHHGKGFLCGHVEALHAMPPKADLFTDIIVEEVMKSTGCASIISTVSRKECDLNRSVNRDNEEGILEYRKAIQDITVYLHVYDSSCQEIIKPYLQLSFHGMKNEHYGPLAMEIGTRNGHSCSLEVKDWLEKILARKAKEFIPEITVVFDQKFIGDPSIAFHRHGTGKEYAGYGPNFHTFQIEISRTIRQKYASEISALFAYILTSFQSTFVTDTNY